MTSTQHVEFGWFIPTSGDSGYLGVPPEREPSPSYLVQVAQEAEQAGYEFALIPAGGDCLDGWVVGSWLAAHTTKLKTLVAVRPGLIAPVLAARMGATLDRLSGGRTLINVVTGHYPADLKATGDPLHADHGGRYKRTGEFLEILKGVWEQEHNGLSAAASLNGAGRKTEGFSFQGEHYQVENAVSRPEPLQRPYPPLYFGGSSEDGKRVAARWADVYLMWAEPLDWIQAQVGEMRRYLDELEAETGIRRQLRYGLRAQVVVRETEEEAWAAARRIISKVPAEQLEALEKAHATTDAVNQTRQSQLYRESAGNGHVIGPNLWSGLTALRGGGAVALVGTPEQITERLAEYRDAGITSFILSGYPHLEEAEITGRLLLPAAKKRLGRTILPN
jgi:alkanesulfonate monooxygenase